MIPLLALAAGCHLFSSSAISTTCEDLPRGCPDQHGEEPGDTGAGDTAEPVEAEPQAWTLLGWSTSETSNIGAVLFDPSGEQQDGVEYDLEALGFDDSALSMLDGPVAYDPGSALFAIWNDYGVFTAQTDSDLPDFVSWDGPARDLLAWEGRFLAALASGFADYHPDGQWVDQETVDRHFQSPQAIFPAREGVYLLDLAEEGPDLYRIDPDEGSAVLSHSHFDTESSRSVDGFSGPDGAPYTCSAAGAVYAVEALSGGDPEPAAYPDPNSLRDCCGTELLDDVRDCGWDPGNGDFLLFSPSAGVLELDGAGAVRRRVEPLDGAFRASFFTP